jgi:hypothetical protein
MAFLTRVLAFSHVVPPSLSSAGRGAARVLLHQIRALERDEQLVVGRIAELHELLLFEPSGSGRDSFQTDEAADAVVHVDHEIADLEVAEI